MGLLGSIGCGALGFVQGIFMQFLGAIQSGLISSVMSGDLAAIAVLGFTVILLFGLVSHPSAMLSLFANPIVLILFFLLVVIPVALC